jgi:hypothetical protein
MTPLETDGSFAASAIDKFELWLATNQPGSTYCYATGLWLEERKRHRSGVYLVDEQTRAVAKAAYKAYDRGAGGTCPAAQ